MRPSLFYAMALIVAVCDQVSKAIVISRLPMGAQVPALGKILYLTHTRNTGGAFSLFQANNNVFVVIAIVAVIALLYAYHRHRGQHLAVCAAISLALGGAIGNVIDRLRFHYVVDFFDFHGGTDRTLWPIFNVADSAITVGILLLLYHVVFVRELAPGPAGGGHETAASPAETSPENATPTA